MLIFLLPFLSSSSFFSMKSTEAHLYAHLARNPLSSALQHWRPACQEALSCYQDLLVALTKPELTTEAAEQLEGGLLLLADVAGP